MRYGYSLSEETCMIVCKKDLCMQSMNHNLIPLFFVRDASSMLDDVLKVQSKHLTKHHHSIKFSDEDLRMPLRLYGIFSHFSSKKLLLSALNDYDSNTLFLTTSNTNRHKKYSKNERSMIDNGQI